MIGRLVRCDHDFSSEKASRSSLVLEVPEKDHYYIIRGTFIHPITGVLFLYFEEIRNPNVKDGETGKLMEPSFMAIAFKYMDDDTYPIEEIMGELSHK